MKVLLISHNPVSSQSNMGKTFLSLFSGFEKQELCQLYIYPAYPDRDLCASYYRVTDKEVLSSFIRWKKPGSEIDRSLIHPQQGLYENPGDQTFYKNRKNKSALRRLLRDAMWSVSAWNNEKLRAWLDQEKPDCIFVAPGAAKFIYKIAIRISKQRNLPIVTYICDENYFVKKPDSALDRLRLMLLKRKIGQLMARTSHLVTISEELRKSYSEHFGISTTTLMTGAGGVVAAKRKIVQEPRTICYFGNIRCNRYVSLCEVGQELDRMNRETGKTYTLKIYTAEKDPKILAMFDRIHSVELCGFLKGDAYTQAMQQADVLLHVEAFDEESIDFTKRSISTKISESLASGIPLLAYGPECIASMRYLQRSESAILAVSKERLGAKLRLALTDETARRNVAENGLAAASVFHDSGKISMTLREIIDEAIGKGSVQKMH